MKQLLGKREQTSAESSGARSWFLNLETSREDGTSHGSKNTNKYLPFLSTYLPVFYDVTIAGGYERRKCNC
jgi:hypothetical protein